MISLVKELIKDSPVGPFAETVNELFTKNGSYNRQTVRVMRQVLKANSSCIDIGAHRGSVLGEILKIAHHGKHFAFEPLPHLCEKLKVRFPGVEVFENAVGDRLGQAKFNYVVNAPAYSGLHKRIYSKEVIVRELEVDVVSLDSIIPENIKVDFIKLDIEGGEFHALQGGLSLIHRNKPIIVFEAGIGSTGEYGVSAGELYNLVSETMGYHLSTMDNWLNGLPAYDLNSFQENWNLGPEYYFIAYPAS